MATALEANHVRRRTVLNWKHAILFLQAKLLRIRLRLSISNYVQSSFTERLSQNGDLSCLHFLTSMEPEEIHASRQTKRIYRWLPGSDVPSGIERLTMDDVPYQAPGDVV